MKHKLSKIALGLAAVCAFSGQAMATNINTTQDLGLIQNLDVANFYNTSSIGKGSFTDLVTFSVASTRLSVGSLTTNLYNSADANSFTISLVSQANPNTVLATGALNSVAGKLATFSLATGFNGAPLAAGNYELKISSDKGALGTSKGSFIGSISPVPEPSEGALLLSGVGLLGFIAARRGRKAA